MASPAEDRVPGEKVQMTVSERNLGSLGPTLESWLAGRAGGTGRPVVTGVRVPDTGGLSSTSVLFEASWGGGRSGAYVARMVQGALARVSVELREAVILRDLQDMDYKEIAQVLSIPEGTVKSRISRGRAELARLLERNKRKVM